MNRKLLIGIVLLALALAFIVPIFRLFSKGESDEMPAQFNMEDQQLVPDKKTLRINININEGSFKLKIFKLFLKRKKNANKANGNIKRLSIKSPTSVSTFTFFLRRL